MGNSVKSNPLQTRSDVERAAFQLIEPLLPLLSSGKARLHLAIPARHTAMTSHRWKPLPDRSGRLCPCLQAAAAG